MSLMSEQSKQGMEHAFLRAAKAGLLRSPEDALDVQPIPHAGVAPAAGETVLVITTSSFAFRLLTMFQVPATTENREYYGGEPDAAMEVAFAEIANLCCGALNRELSNDFPHLGMSIPFALGARCLANLDELKPEHVCRYGITINGSVRLEATLCICCSAPVQISARPQAMAASTGELELF
jgi:hypothetical protein